MKQGSFSWSTAEFHQKLSRFGINLSEACFTPRFLFSPRSFILLSLDSFSRLPILTLGNSRLLFLKLLSPEENVFCPIALTVLASPLPPTGLAARVLDQGPAPWAAGDGPGLVLSPRGRCGQLYPKHCQEAGDFPRKSAFITGIRNFRFLAWKRR